MDPSLLGSNFLHVDVGQIAQIAVVLGGIIMMFQRVRDDIKHHDERLDQVETKLDDLGTVVTNAARLDERISAMDQRLLAQGQRLDAQATIINGRLEAINNIVAGHTAKIDRLVEVGSIHSRG